jgi:hypothetical protein
MQYGIEEIGARLEIEDVITRYSLNVDTKNWAAYEDVCTPDAILDFSEIDGPVGSAAECRASLEFAAQHFVKMQHILASFTLLELDLGEGTARSRIAVLAPVVAEVDAQPHVFFTGAWYHDELRRMPEGWRIHHRRTERVYFHNLPPGFTPPT